MDNLKFIRETADSISSVISAVNRLVWQNAEPGYQEHASSSFISELLQEEGFSIHTQAGGLPTAIEARWGSSKPVIGILGEYDALPGLSQEAGIAAPSPVSGKSFGHGCGHSALGAGAAGAAILIKRWLQASGVQGSVVFFGCPAEEEGYGKTFMAKAGCFSDLDAALTWHPADTNSAVAIRMTGYYKVRFDFHGRTAHAGNNPELGRSALDACELMNVGVNYLREHIISQARVHYAYLNTGGSAPNIVPENASLLYFIRAPKLKESAAILERVKKIAQGAALMTETDVKITVLGGMSDVIPNLTLAELMADCYQQCGGTDFGEEEYKIARRYLESLPDDAKTDILTQGAKLHRLSEKDFSHRPLNTAVLPFSRQMAAFLATGSSDVGDVSYLVPTAQLTAAAAIPGTGLHTWQFTGQVGTSIGDKAAVAAARVIALTAARLYEQPRIIETAKKELLSETGGFYQSPIPDDITWADVIPT